MNQHTSSSVEKKRLEVLREYDVLGSPPEEAFDDLTALAAHLCESPVSLITLIDKDREWCKSAFGFQHNGNSREFSFCAQAIQQPDLFIVPDAIRDERFANNPYVTGTPNIRFYAGVPLVSTEGEALGALCVIDFKSREMKPAHQQALRVLSRHVMTLLELRRKNRELASVRTRLDEEREKRVREQAEESIRTERSLNEQIVNSLPGIFYVIDEEGRFLRWNENFERVTGYSSKEMRRLHPLDLFRGTDVELIAGRIREVFETGRSDAEATLVGKAGQGALYYFTGLRIEFDGRRCLIGTGIDVSARRLAEVERDRLFELSPDMFCIAGLDGYFKQVNPAWEKTLGYSEEELLARPYVEFIHPEDREATESETEALATERGNVVFENRYRCKDGIWRWLSWRCVMLPEAGLIFGVARDITEKKQTRDALRASEARFEAFMEDNPAVAWMKDEDGRYVYVNQTLLKVYGGDRARVLGKTDLEFLPGPVAAELRGNDRAVREQDRPGEYTETIPDSEGQVRVWKVWKFPFEDPSGRCYSGGLAFEITERIKAEEAVLRSEERYRSLVEGARDAIFSLSSDGSFTSLNAAAETLTGWKGEELLGGPFSRIVHPEDLPKAVKAFQQVLNGAATPTLELRILAKECDCIPMELTVTPQRLGDKVIGVLGIARDIRERRQLEEQLRQSQKLDSIGQLAAGIAHDFNNILTVQQGHASLLLLNEDLPPACVESIRQMADAVDRAAALTRQLLLFSRKQALQPKLLNLNEIVANLAIMLGRILGEDIELHIEKEEHLPSLKADPGMIEQVIMNLAVNARDAMPGGGKLEISTSAVRLDESAPRNNPEARSGNFVCLRISDTGTGISPDASDHIFEPFFTTKDVGKGTGLGLATVHGIVRQHEGWVEVDSREGTGTSFTIFLPACVEDTGAAVEATPVDTVRGGSETILVVEVEEAVRGMVKLVLEKYGYTVLVAENGVHALDVWQQNAAHIDLLLSDLVLPEGINGLQLAERLLRYKPELRIILSSGYSPDLAKGNVSISDRTRFLQKPYPLQMLLQTVRDLSETGSIEK
ncbi:MAG: PAS domain S-box protein [Opitutales bacterium]|nr:PAS domain S-box protein [Opitutales bacterium]